MDSVILIAGIGILSILLIITIFCLICYSGLFDGISVGAGQPPCRNLKVLYKFGRGSYKDVGPVFTEVTAYAPKNTRCFGVYYDDPRQVAVSKLRWAVGCVIAEGSEDPDTTLMQTLTKEGYKCFQFPAVNNVVRTSFPFRTQLSVFVGIYRVYPQLASYIREMKLCAHPFVELYAADTIHYFAPLSKQEGFYVPEANPDYVDPHIVAWDGDKQEKDVTGSREDPGEGTSKTLASAVGEATSVADPDTHQVILEQTKEESSEITLPKQCTLKPGQEESVLSDGRSKSSVDRKQASATERSLSKSVVKDSKSSSQQRPSNTEKNTRQSSSVHIEKGREASMSGSSKAATEQAKKMAVTHVKSNSRVCKSSGRELVNKDVRVFPRSPSAPVDKKPKHSFDVQGEDWVRTTHTESHDPVASNDHNYSLNSGVTEVQDAGITSTTISEHSLISEYDSMSDKSGSISPCSSFLSDDTSFSYNSSYLPSDMSYSQHPSPGSPLVELSSDSDDEKNTSQILAKERDKQRHS